MAHLSKDTPKHILEDAHDAKMLRKRARNMTMTTGCNNRAIRFHFPLTKNDHPEYRKPFARDFNR